MAAWLRVFRRKLQYLCSQAHDAYIFWPLEQPLMEGRSYLLEAQRALNDGREPRHRLMLASQQFWKAMFYEDTWSRELRVRAAALVRHLFSKGPITETIAHMSDTQIRQTLQELAEFIQASELTEKPPSSEE
jgi:hypothetical protein